MNQQQFDRKISVVERAGEAFGKALGKIKHPFRTLAIAGTFMAAVIIAFAYSMARGIKKA